MKRNVLYKICLLFTLLSVAVSCVDDVDFDQANDIQVTPTIESNLIFFELPAASFINSQTQQEVIILTDTTRLEIISDSFFEEGLKRVDLLFNFENSLERSFQIELEFVDDNDDLKYEISSEILEGTTDNITLLNIERIIQDDELSTFKEATKVIQKFSLAPTSSPLSETSEGILKLKSKATFYIEL